MSPRPGAGSRVPIFQVDAFTRQRFAGNPAAVLLLQAYPDDAPLLAVLQGECAFYFDGVAEI